MKGAAITRKPAKLRSGGLGATRCGTLLVLLKLGGKRRRDLKCDGAIAFVFQPLVNWHTLEFDRPTWPGILWRDGAIITASENYRRMIYGVRQLHERSIKG
jgi:hypothetical protein